METNQDGSEVQETTDNTETEAVETSEAAALSPEEIADLKKKAEASSQNFERAKKAEAELKEAKKLLQDKVPSQEALSNKDIIYLAKADIHADDVDEVLELSRKMSWDVQKAHTYLKPRLDILAEERKTAANTQIKGGARGASKTTGEDLLRKAELRGELPESDADYATLAQARINRLKANAK